jgi:Protein of unknown function (DUF1570)
MSGLPRCAPVLTAACLGLLVGCHTFKVPGVGADKTEKVEKETALARPGKYSFRVSQYVFYSDFEIKHDQPIFRELSDLRDQLYKELQLPAPGSDTLIHVYLFADKDNYESFIQTRYPGLPDRRAFFMEEQARGLSKGELLVFTFWSDRIRNDLRHELTHALLHSVLKDVPLWLDEGLAEYYEVPPTWNGLDRRHVRILREKGIRPDLARLEQLSEVKDMDADRYREAWAWVYLMLRGNPKAKEVLLAYLQQLRTKPNAGPLQPRLAEAVPGLDDALDRLLVQAADDGHGSKR